MTCTTTMRTTQKPQPGCESLSDAVTSPSDTWTPVASATCEQMSLFDMCNATSLLASVDGRSRSSSRDGRGIGRSGQGVALASRSAPPERAQGGADCRDLWPTWKSLISECRPPVVFGEQSADSIRHGWVDRLQYDLEAESYSVGYSVLRACGVGAPHQRKRLYIVAADNICQGGEGLVQGQNSVRPRQWNWRGKEDLQLIAERPLDGNRLWPQPIIRSVDDGVPFRVASLHGYGNAIVPQVAAEFIQAFVEVTA